MKQRIEDIQQRYKPHFELIRPWIPAVCFLGGSSWDWLTLGRIDNPLDLTIMALYLLGCGTLVVLVGRQVQFRFSHLLPNGIQFFLGGLLSPFTVLYFKSAATAPSVLFMFLVAGLLVGNEFLEKKFSNVLVGFLFFGICAFMYLNFFVPIVLNHMNGWIFVLSLLLAFGVCALLRRLGRVPRHALVAVGVLYAGLSLLYALNVIPPVPLSKKHLGVYRSVVKQDNVYECTFARPPWYAPFRTGEKNFLWHEGDTVFCFSSVYAPAKLRKKIYHHWYRRKTDSGKYRETDRVGYTMAGGRRDGYRGYTFKRNVTPGEWKVEVRTDDNRILGVVAFRIEETRDSVKTRVVRR